MPCDCNGDRESSHMCALPCRVFPPEMSTVTNADIDYISSGTNNLEPSPSCSTVRSDRLRAERASGVEVSGGDPYGAPSVAPMVEKWVSACFPEGSESSLRELEEVIMEASDAAREDHDEASTNKWAAGYEFPQQYTDSDVACLRAAGLDFTKMMKRRLALISANRLSRERIERTLREDNPEHDRMLDFAIGMKVHKPDGFVPNGCQPRYPLRTVYCSISSAVNKMLGAVVEQKLVFLLPLSMAQEHVPNLHLCKAHWTTKKGKASGRPLGDLSNVDGTPINTDETAAAATAYYGQIRHPTIDGITTMIHEFWTEARTADPTVQWSELRLWKMDPKGGFFDLAT